MEDFFKIDGDQLGRTANFNLRLFVPIVNMIAYNVHHERTLWGIRFPVHPFHLDQPIINIVQKDLEGSGSPAKSTRFQRFDLAVVFLSIIVKRNWKFIEHKIVISFNGELKLLCQAEPFMQLTDLRESHPGHLAV